MKMNSYLYGLKKGLPIGLHIIGNKFEEAKMYGFASFLEGKIGE